MKKKTLAIVFCAVLALASLSACGQSGAGGETDPSAAVTDNGGSTVSTGLTAADLSVSPDVTIAFGDYDGMMTLGKDILDGNMEGKVVSIDGVVSNYGAGMSYNIGERNADDTKTISTQFRIEGAEEADYPSDGDRVSITGKIVSDPENRLLFYIATLPDFVEVLG